jgi:hypothetical protein
MKTKPGVGSHIHSSSGKNLNLSREIRSVCLHPHIRTSRKIPTFDSAGGNSLFDRLLSYLGIIIVRSLRENKVYWLDYQTCLPL